MKVVLDVVLVLQQPVDGGFVVHRLANRFGGGFAISLEEDVVIKIGRVYHARVEPDGDVDPEVVVLVGALAAVLILSAVCAT